VPLSESNDLQTHDQRVFQEWSELRKIMLTTRGQMPTPVVTPGKFIYAVHEMAKIKGRDIFTGWAQNDLPEFLLQSTIEPESRFAVAL